MAGAETYPVRVNAELDPPLSRWLWLVKWVLVIPHYIVVGIFVGGTWFAWRYGGLIDILALIAAVTLLVTGSYPRAVYDFVLGMNRWVLRVAGYASLMTDQYPPFRLDMGGHETGYETGQVNHGWSA